MARGVVPGWEVPNAQNAGCFRVSPAPTATDRMPLSGIRVVELGRMLAAPLTAQLLGDLGADVVKIEQRGEGDYFRRYGLISVKRRPRRSSFGPVRRSRLPRNWSSIYVVMCLPRTFRATGAT